MKYSIKFKNNNEINYFINKVSKYQNVIIDIKYGSYTIDGKSLLGILSIGLNKPLDINIDGSEMEINELTKDISNIMII